MNKTIEHIRKMLKDYNDPIDLENEDGEGIILDTVMSAKVPPGGYEVEYNIDIHTIYPSLKAETNFGIIDLVEKVKDEDDWYTIEEVVSDVLGIVCNENISESFQK